MSNTVLKLQKVTKIFGGKGDLPLVEIFNGMDFSVKTNEVVGLFSPSGSGKTTFLQIAGLLDSKFSGDIYINGSIVDAKNDFQKSIMRRKNIGFGFNPRVEIKWFKRNPFRNSGDFLFSPHAPVLFPIAFHVHTVSI